MRTWKTLISVLLIAALLCGLAAVPSLADEDDGSPVFDLSEAEEESFSVGVFETVLEDGDTFVEPGDDYIPENSLSMMNEGSEPLAGEPEPVADPAAAGGDDDTLAFDESFDESLENEDLELLDEWDLGENADDGHLGGIGGAEVRFPQDKLVLSKGESVTLNVSYSNAPSNAKLLVGVWKNAVQQSNVVSCQVESGSGGTAKLKITANETGTCYVMVYLLNSLYLPLDWAKLPTNVSAAYLSPVGSLADFCVEESGSKTASFQFGGYSGAGQLKVTSTNNAAFGCAIADASGNRFNVRVTGRTCGSGQVKVQYIATATGNVLASREFTVTVTPKTQPKLTLSTQGLSITKSTSRSVFVTYSGYSGNVKLRVSQDSDAVSCTWGSWSGTTVPLTIRGAANGSGTVTIQMLSSAGVQLAKAQLKVTVAPQPTISGGALELSFESGQSASTDLRITNITRENTISCTVSNSSICSASISGSDGNYRLTVAGRNVGFARVAVAVKDSYGNTVASKNLQVTVRSAPPRVTVSQSNVTVTVGQSAVITAAISNTSGNVKLCWSRSDSNSSAVWGTWYGNSIPLTITGAKEGSSTYTITLRRSSDNAQLASAAIRVTVTPRQEEKLLDISTISYAFNNYSTTVSLLNYQRLFGNNQKASTLHSRHEYDNNGVPAPHGVCFGMATSSALFKGGNLNAWDFGAAKISGLTENIKKMFHNSLGLRLSDIIELMYTSQFAVAMSQPRGVDKVARAVISEIDAGRPVCIGFNGEAGHEVMAIGYNRSGDKLTLSIYDNNYNRQIQKLVMTRPSASSSYDTWTYTTPGNYTYSSAKHHIDYTEYATVAYVWRNRGKADVINSPMKGKNFVITREDEFELYTVDLNTMEKTTVARIQDGELTDAAEDVQRFQITNEQEDNPNILIVPAEYYYIEDGTPEDGLAVTIVDELLSTTIETDRSDTRLGAMGFCAVDAEHLAEAAISVAEGANYQISIGMTDEDGSSKIISKGGVGMGQSVTLGTLNGDLNLGDGTDGAAVSVEPYRVTYGISAVASEGGTVSPAGETLLNEGENQLYSFRPAPGYSLDRVLIDGEDMGPVYSWYFEDVSAHHTVTAVFKQNMADFQMELSRNTFVCDGTEKRPEAVILDRNGNALIENIDYILAYNNNVAPGEAELVAVALPDSPYYGSLEAKFTILDRTDEGEVTAATREENMLYVTLSDSAYDTPKLLMLGVYDAAGRMTASRLITPETRGEQLVIPLEELDIPEQSELLLFLLRKDNLVPCADRYRVP